MSQKKWTKASVLEAIQDWHQDRRLPGNIRETDDAFYRAVRKHFGSWYEAQIAAGLKPPPRRKWTAQSILLALRDAHEQGRSLKAVWREDRSLCCSATRRFGSWQKALAAAGLQPYRRTWSKQGVLEAIRSWHEKGLSLTKVWRDDVPLYCNAKRFFGTWKDALRAAGLEPKRKSWTKQSIIETIRVSHDQGRPESDLWNDNALASAVGQYFGTRDQARKAAGLSPKPHRRWTKDTVMKALRVRHKQGLSLAQTWKEDRALASAAVRRFGSFHNALLAAGLKPNVRKWSEQRVIQELRAHFSQGAANSRVWRQDQYLVQAAKKYFGSREDALWAAGIDPSHVLWCKERVITAIQDGWVKGASILVAGFGDRLLASAATVHFGGWPKALAAAGLSSRYAQAMEAAGLGTTSNPHPHSRKSA